MNTPATVTLGPLSYSRLQPIASQLLTEPGFPAKHLYPAVISINWSLQAPPGGQIKRQSTGCRSLSKPRRTALTAALLVPISLLISATALRAQQIAPQITQQIAEIALPDSPTPNVTDPQTPASSPTPQPNPCPQPASPFATGAGPKPPAVMALTAAGSAAGVHPALVPCTRRPLNWYERFVNGPQGKPLTPRDKAWLAVRNLADPFNLITIGGDAAISVAADSRSPYGPGMPGFARYVGVSFTQDLTGEFFGTFLIPSIAHQDPHYHRMERARIPRRIGHALLQVVWTQSDNGKGMLNYANLVGFAADDAISNLYVPGRETAVGASFARYATGLATAPIGNFVNEFLPDVASHIHVQIILIQRIINQVANKETMNAQ